MTDTRITVDVSTEALLQRARQQQAQSRQAAIQREEERREVERQKREARKAGRDQPPGQDRLKGRSKLRGMAPRHEVAAAYLPGALLCVAVLDESSQTAEYLQEKWNSFRLKYGKNRQIAVLCVSYPGFGFNLESSFVQTYPDIYMEIEGIPFPMTPQQIKRYRVTRNDQLEGGSSPEPPSIWQDVLAQQLKGARMVLLAVDASGSMVPANVQESYDSFVLWANAKGIKLYRVNMGGLEDYVSPFDVQIKDLERLYPP